MAETPIYEPIKGRQPRAQPHIHPKLHLVCMAHAYKQHLNLRAAVEQLIKAGFAAYRLDQWYRLEPYESLARNEKLNTLTLHPQIDQLVEIYRKEHPCSRRCALEFLIKQGLAAWYTVHKL